MNALVITDVQNDFLPGGALAVPQGDKVIPVVNRIQKNFDLILATQDWHPADHGSFAANHPGKRVGDVVDLNGIDQILWPVHCVQNTHGAQLAKALDKTLIQHVFHKGIDPQVDSYSTFFDNAHKRSTGLGEFLQARGVSEVYLVGLATDYCVKYSALDARGLGFATSLIEDGCRGIELAHGDIAAAIREMKNVGVTVVRSGQQLAVSK